jgi:hypothetical protein
MASKVFITVVLILSCLRASSQDSLVHFTDVDIHNFWNYYDQFKKDTTTNPFKDFFTVGSPALKEFVERWDNGEKYWKRNVVYHDAHLDHVRNSEIKLETCQDEIQSLFEEFRKIYPEAQAPKVHFVIGALTTLCGTNKHGVLIGLDVFCDTTAQHAGPFKPLPYQQLPIRTTECIIRYNSRTAYIGYNLLREAIVEGSISFLTGLLSPEYKNRLLSGETFKYGDAHEEMLVKEFLQRKYDMDFRGWSHYKDETGRPRGLGDWIGYRITEAYYNNSVDKKKAVDEILEINDFEKFLALSGYTGIFGN